MSRFLVVCLPQGTSFFSGREHTPTRIQNQSQAPIVFTRIKKRSRALTTSAFQNANSKDQRVCALAVASS